MPSSLYQLVNTPPPGAIYECPTTGYFVRNANGDLGVVPSDAPRFAYDAALGNTAYLSEPPYENLFTAPEDFTNAAWVHQQNPGDVSVDANVGAAPDGSATADRLNFLTGSSNTGLSQAESGLVVGTNYMTSVFVQEDTDPDDYMVRNPAGGVNFVTGVAGASWTRVIREDTVVAGYSGIYIRRNAGTGGALRLWGAMRHADALGKIFNYHPGTFGGSWLKVPNFALDGEKGTFALKWVPYFDADQEIGGAETVIADAGGLRLTWAGDDTPSYIRLYNGNTVVATWQTRHSRGDVHYLAVYFGDGLPPHLEINGVIRAAADDWVPFDVPPYTHVGCDADGNQCFGLHQQLYMDTERLAPLARFASLGDSISAEPYGSDTASWNRRAGELLRLQGKAIVVAGVPNDRFEDVLARVSTDVIAQGVAYCVVFCGINDIVANATAVEMETTAAAVYAALKAAGIYVIAVTITPFGGAGSWNPLREAERVAFNTWHRAGPLNVDYVFDADVLLRDPGTPTQLLPLYDSGDHVHLSTAGGEAYAEALIDEVSPGDAVLNGHFELAGLAPGLAESWDFGRTASNEQLAAFNSTDAAVEAFDAEWRMPNETGPFTNEFSLFEFVDDVHLEAAEFAGLPRDAFEFGWDNDGGLLDDFDAINTTYAQFGTQNVAYEGYASEWYLPADPGPQTNDEGLGDVRGFFDGTEIGPYIIALGVNDTIYIDFEPSGTPSIQPVITPGTYDDATAMAAALQTAIDAAVAAAGYSYTFTVSVVDDCLRIELTSGGDYFRLRAVSVGSAWGTLGFTAVERDVDLWHFSGRPAATLGVANFDPFGALNESFDLGWRDNETGYFSFPPARLHQATLGAGVTAPEDFEQEWDQELVL